VPAESPPVPPADKETLIAMLRKASELEHALCCQYLYAAFTLKQAGEAGLTASEGALTSQWHQQVTKVAVQEMYHLMLASDLLTAVGSEPHLWRPNFPQPDTRYSNVDLPSLLAPFDLETLTRFMCWEKPEQHGWWDDFCKQCEERVRARHGLQASAEPPPYDSIGQLYGSIAEGLKENPGWIDPSTAPKQVTSELVPFSPKVAAITTAEQACAFIEIIVLEGEGVEDWDSQSHFAYYHQIVDQLTQLAQSGSGFEAAWPTVESPIYDPANMQPGATLIDDPVARLVGLLFNDVYLLLMRVLARLFLPQGEEPPQRKALANAAMAMMPLAIKPLGALLARLPAGSEHPGLYAGPSFELPQTFDLPTGVREEALPALREDMLRVTVRARMVSIETVYLPPAARATLEGVAARLETLLPLLDVQAEPAGIGR
jgi:hypothetical protein